MALADGMPSKSAAAVQAAADSRMKRQAVVDLKALPEWQAMEDDLDNLTNRIARYDPDYAAATNKIGLVTDAKTVTALTKVLAVVDDVMQCVRIQKQLNSDYKRIIKASVTNGVASKAASK